MTTMTANPEFWEFNPLLRAVIKSSPSGDRFGWDEKGREGFLKIMVVFMGEIVYNSKAESLGKSEKARQMP